MIGYIQTDDRNRSSGSKTYTNSTQIDITSFQDNDKIINDGERERLASVKTINGYVDPESSVKLNKGKTIKIGTKLYTVLKSKNTMAGSFSADLEFFLNGA